MCDRPATPIAIRRRSHSESLRWIADKLGDDVALLGHAVVLHSIADELDAEAASRVKDSQ
jgi:predicted RecB family endonuclease